jgi:hypothetical protein
LQGNGPVSFCGFGPRLGLGLGCSATSLLKREVVVLLRVSQLNSSDRLCPLHNKVLNRKSSVSEMDDNIQFKINNPDIAVTSLRILGAQQFLTATESTQVTFHIPFSRSFLSSHIALYIPSGLAFVAIQLYKIEVSTSNGNYIIHRTFTELKDRHAVVSQRCIVPLCPIFTSPAFTILIPHSVWVWCVCGCVGVGV